MFSWRASGSIWSRELNSRITSQKLHAWRYRYCAMVIEPSPAGASYASRTCRSNRRSVDERCSLCLPVPRVFGCETHNPPALQSRCLVLGDWIRRLTGECRRRGRRERIRITTKQRSERGRTKGRSRPRFARAIEPEVPNTNGPPVASPLVFGTSGSIAHAGRRPARDRPAAPIRCFLRSSSLLPFLRFDLIPLPPSYLA